MSPAVEKGSLGEYRRKRNFTKTPEPAGAEAPSSGSIFVVQKHAASHLHYDFRLRLHGALKSWAVPKGPSLDPSQHRLASETEDHPLEYAGFEGVIPAGEYGAGTVLIWDTGEWEPLEAGKQGYYRGRLDFVLHGRRLRGRWSLVLEDRESRRWTLVKYPDEFASGEDVLAEDTSVVTGRTLEEVAADHDRLWSSRKGEVSAEQPPVFGHRSGGRLPAFIAPQPATLVTEVPAGEGWLHEIKYDGYRMVCRVDKEGCGVRFYTRKGVDFTDRLPSIARAMGRLPLRQGWFDGEIVLFNDQGTQDFHALQDAMRGGKDAQVRYMVFDLMNYEGYDLRGAPLSERKALLADLIPKLERVQYVDHVVGQGEEFYRQACSRNLEGIVSKQADSGYQAEPSRRWLKVKCAQRQEVVVGGYTESGVGRPFGSLLGGYYDREGRLIFAGKVRSGYSSSSSLSLLDTLRRYEQPEPPFLNPPSGPEYRSPHWLRPELVAEVAYSDLAGSGQLRHASFKGMREDKDAREVRLEIGAPAQHAAPPRKQAPVFPHERLHREDILRYYGVVGPRMLPHLRDRPLTLIVCPTNIYRCQFKKHATHFPPPVRPLEIAGHAEPYLAVDSVEGLLTLVEAGSVEFHAWQSRYSDLEHPDRLLFDLDPPETGEVPWEELAEAALLLRIHLEEYGLEAFLQTTGGKGYYVVAPLSPERPWQEVTSFARRTAEEMERKRPDRFSARLAKNERGGRIYLDWMRNGRGAHAAEPYSLRARPGAPVATPISWEELVAGVRPDAFSLVNIAERLEQLARDPWEGFFTVRQRIP